MARVVRLVIRQNGAKKTFLKIVEGKGGKLTITSDVADPSKPEPAIYWRDKLSVHLSEKSGGSFRSLHTTQIIDGSRTDIHARLPVIIGKPFVYPVVGRMINRLDQGLYDPQDKGAFESIELGGYDTNRSTMFISCFLTERNLSLPSAPGLSKVVVKFTTFKLTFYYYYSTLGSQKLPVQLNVITAPKLVNNIAVGGRFMTARPIEPENVPRYVLHQRVELIRALLKSAHAYHKAENTLCPLPPLEAWDHTLTPQFYDADDKSFGLNALYFSETASEYLHQYARSLENLELTENGTTQDHVDYITNIIIPSGIFSEEDLKAAAGGSLIKFLEAAKRP